jgi:hypothetical protein
MRANLAESAGRRSVTVPSQPRKNATGMATIPGLFSGKNAKLTCRPVISDELSPETTGEKTIRPTAVISPP